MYGSEYSLSVSDSASKRIPSVFSFLPENLPPKKVSKKRRSYSSNSPSFVNSSSQEEFLLDIPYVQARRSVSCIEDPLWKQVCGELISMMGPLSVLKIWESHLGSFSAHSQEIEIHCKSEEMAQFVEQYAFVILGSLQRYFSTIKKLKIKVK